MFNGLMAFLGVARLNTITLFRETKAPFKHSLTRLRACSKYPACIFFCGLLGSAPTTGMDENNKAYPKMVMLPDLNVSLICHVPLKFLLLCSAFFRCCFFFFASDM